MSGDTIYDVIIVGGGLAGLALAIQLGQQRYKVLVLEKEDYPRHKVCGEYISMESKPFLEGLGLPVSAMQLPEITKLLVTDVKGYAMESALPQGGFGISRYMLDHQLATLARLAGVTLFTRTKATSVQYTGNAFEVCAGGNTYTASVACGAWGKRSNIDVQSKRPFITGKSRGLNNYTGIKYHIKYPWDESLIALHNFTNGYCGISRVEDDTCCLCYLTTTANLQQCGNDIKEMERRILTQNPNLKKIFTEAEFLFPQPITISQISFQKKEQVLDHVLLMGDAAGLITPLCGNGMSMAFHASKIAFGAVHSFLQQRLSRAAMEQEYVSEWRKQLSSRLTAGRLLQSSFGKNVVTSAFLRTANTLPFLKTAIISSASGRSF
jgi:flavin-dependent dehydrogenase